MKREKEEIVTTIYIYGVMCHVFHFMSEFKLPADSMNFAEQIVLGLSILEEK